jgi:uncharacterized damage-inducible protein DinB
MSQGSFPKWLDSDGLTKVSPHFGDQMAFYSVIWNTTCGNPCFQSFRVWASHPWRPHGSGLLSQSDQAYSLGVNLPRHRHASNRQDSMLLKTVLDHKSSIGKRPNMTYTSAKPQAIEYAPYYERYISLVPDGNILETIEEQRRDTILLLSSRNEQDGDFRYAPNKWSAKDVLGHINDSERVFAYRALRIARNDATPMEGFEQDDYVRNAPFASSPFADLIEDFIAVRRATVSLLRNLDETAWLRRGVANKNEVSVRALVWIIAGHELHHRRILENKYFSKTPV